MASFSSKFMFVNSSFMVFFFGNLMLIVTPYCHERTLTLEDENYLTLKPEKLTHFHFYFHDVVEGRDPTTTQVAGPRISRAATVFFGGIVVMDNPLTVEPDRKSKEIGRAQGIYVIASQTEAALHMTLNYIFTDGQYKGSTLSLVCRNLIFTSPREMAIVGGTGVFRFARGYAVASNYNFNFTKSLDAIVEYNVYVYHF